MRALPVLIAFLAAIQLARAQLPYTEVRYEYRVDTGIYYGTAINYAGNPVDLHLDLYKPLNDGNTARPVIIIVSGGLWINGGRTGEDVTLLAPWFARRGYVAVAVDYRLGLHPSTGRGSNTTFCRGVTQEINCGYPADSNELIRGVYRGMQDVKGAVRFLKARSAEDSTCSGNVYLAGISVGGFIALAAAYMDNEAEKPHAAGELPDAPGNASNPLSYCHGYFNHDTDAISRKRPDLGSIHGSIALNGSTPEVKGIASFMGGLQQDLFATSSSESFPLLYLFHQTSDLAINCNYAPLLSALNSRCIAPLSFLGCVQVANTPRAFGACGIKTLIETNQYPVEYFDAIVHNGDGGCLQSPPGHSMLSPQQRVGEVVAFFAPRIAETEKQSCPSATQTGKVMPPGNILYPVPAQTHLVLRTPEPALHLTVTDLSGRSFPVNWTAIQQHEIRLDVSSLPKGLYFIRWREKSGKPGIARFSRI